MVYVCIRLAWKHVANHDGALVSKVVIDGGFAAVFGFRAYSLFTWSKRNSPKDGTGP
jgi:hypothetical protein